MSLIHQEIKVVDAILQEFEEDIKANVFKNQAETIVNKMLVIIDRLAPKYSLISKNSIRSIKHYNIITRVKESNSLKEKLIRNNIINEFINEVVIENIDGVTRKKIKNKLYNLDDLIGVKILTDLNIDCKNMHDLLRSPEFRSEAEANNIELNEKDLDNQPQKMRNGLEIYKIRCNHEKYSFELQIKSKLVSSWGDMEHSIFYKDYAITPVRDTAQKSMNHVGKLLFDIDEFVESIRNANKDYSENAKALYFLSWFEEKYSPIVSTLLQNVNFKFDSISEILFQVDNVKKISKSSEFQINDLRFDHFLLKSTDEEKIHYINIRNRNYNLKILESIILSWYIDKKVIINIENLDDIITLYFKVVKDATVNFMMQYFEGYDETEMDSEIAIFHKISLKYQCNETFLIDIQKLKTFFSDWNFSKSIFEEVNPKLKDLIFIQLNNGNVDKYISDKEGEISKENIRKELIKLSKSLNDSGKVLKKISARFKSVINHLIQ